VTKTVTEDRITGKLRRRSPLIGDDCAVVPAPKGKDLLFTTDFTIEGVHFTRDAPAARVGHRALVRGLSDIAAMGGTPKYCLVSLAAAPWTDEKWIDAFYTGLLGLARLHKTKLAGGDLSHASQLVADIVVYGVVAHGKALKRSGARPGDRIWVSGPLGGWHHKVNPEPQLAAGRKLAGRATACLDITDGLALDLHRLCKESGVSAEIESIPLLPGATLDQALFDGEDYELLFTSRHRVNPGFCIGTITRGEPGRVLFRGEPVSPRGYDHFQQPRP
jgi:thiamine-monophosphate kinase